MFWDKEKKEKVVEGNTISVQTIPADFYGGVNPVIKFKRVEKEVVIGDKKEGMTGNEKKILEKMTSAGAGASMHPANLFSNKKYLMIFGVIVFALFAIGASIYYFNQSNKAQTPQKIVNQPKIQQPPSETTAPPETEELPQITPTSTEEVKMEVAKTVEAKMEYPSMLLADNADLDNDGIVDVAEEIFKSDSGAADSDNDKYNDGHEVYNLYNPAGFEPIKLIDSGTINDFLNPTHGYKVYYPASWAVGSVDSENDDVLFSAITGENVELRVFKKENGQSFEDWLAKSAPNQKLDDLTQFESKFGDKGYRRTDYLVYYFADDNNIYVLAYHTIDSGSINFKIIIKMMARSFRMSTNVRTEIAPLPVEEPGI